MRCVGFDSIKVELGAFSTRFEGLLGVGVTALDYSSFKEKYVASLKSLFESRGIRCDRLVCKSADISKFIHNSEEMIEFLEDFFDNINDEIERLDIYCTRYVSRKLPRITIYGADRPQYVKPVEFIRKIANAYPHICAWRYLSHFYREERMVYLDHFESDQTLAWDYISKFPNVKVLYKGDNCNCLISSADLLIRLTVLLLKKYNAGFNWRGLKELHSHYLWGTKTSANTLGGQTYILKNITPYSHKPIDLSDFINHPIVFIPPERPGGIRSNEERQLFENMPIYDKLLNFLFYLNGSFKYFTPEDIKLVKKGDYMLIMGRHGEELFNYLTAGGVSLRRITLEEMKDKLKEFEKE